MKFYAVIPGRRVSAGPGIQKLQDTYLDSGFAPNGAPRNDEDST